MTEADQKIVSLLLYLDIVITLWLLLWYIRDLYNGWRQKP